MHPTKRYSRDEPQQLVGTLPGQGGASFSMQGAAAAMAAARGGVHAPSTTSHRQHVAQFRAAQMMAAAQNSNNVAVGMAAARAAGVNVDHALSAAGRQDLMPFLAPRPSPGCPSQNLSMKSSKTNNVQHLSQSSSSTTLTNGQPVPIAPADAKKQRKGQSASADTSHNNASGTNNTKESKPLEIPPLGAPLPSMTDMLMLDIPTPFIHPHDVLCGRGGGTNNHAGNEKFRALVNSKKVEYLHSIKREKPRVSRGIVRAVRNQHPPGRFLQKDEKTGLWYDIGDQKAQEKTSQALRERAPELRREITNNLGVDANGQRFSHLSGPLSYRNLSLAATRAAIAKQAESNGLDVPPKNTAQKGVLSAGAPGFAMHAAAQQALAAQQVAAAASQQAVAAQRAALQGVPHQYEQLRLHAAARVKHSIAMQHHQKQAAMRHQAVTGAGPNSSMLRPVVQSQQAMQGMRLSHPQVTGRPMSSSMMAQSDPLRHGRTDNASGMHTGMRLGLRSTGGMKNDYPLGPNGGTRPEMFASRSMAANDPVMNKFNANTKKGFPNHNAYHSMKASGLERNTGNGKKRDQAIRGNSVNSLPYDCIRRLDLAEMMAQRTVNGTITEEQKNEEYRISLYLDAGLLGIPPGKIVQALSQGKTESDLVSDSDNMHGKKRKLDGILPPLRKAPRNAGAIEGLGALTESGIQNALSVIGAKK